MKVRGYAVEITIEFERILENTAKRFDISTEKLSFDISGAQRAIEIKIINDELSKIPIVLCSAIGKAYPKNEKFLSILKGNIEKILSRQQIINSGNQEQGMALNNEVPSSLFNSIIIELTSDKGLMKVM
ncbi:MAG: hypothetical protein ACR5KV_06885 [Wolbachia sp.]